MNVDGTKGAKQAKQLKNRTNSWDQGDQASKAHSTLCTAMTPSWLQVVDGITEEWRAQRISLGCNREGGDVVVVV